MYEVVMPRLSDSMEEGTVIRWLKEDGAEVARGEEIVEIETDKATMPYEADVAGTLSIAIAAGATVAVGAVIATIGDAVAAAPAGTALGATAAAATAPAHATRPRAAPSLAVAAVSAAQGNGNGRAINASPVARRMAGRLGVELTSLTGSGPYGRILKADVVVAQRAKPDPALVGASATAPEAGTPAADGSSEDLSRAQTVIARRMAESRATVPDFSVEADVDMSAALDLRAKLKQIVTEAPSLNDIVVKAAAAALHRHPRANGSYRDGRFLLHEGVNVGVAVAGDDTLVVPVVRDAHVKSLGAIAAETRALAARVRLGTITAQELSGGTFTVSNLGMFGIDRFEGIINAPQAAILCVGAIRERPVAVDGEVLVRPMMTLTLACDHRILYGADAARLLSDVRELLEQPLALAL
jgi:pyruvate dehydrogenase E2 component (dihydrolipoamide acetyltransferase)